MDDAQTNHLKAYGIAYLSIQKEIDVNWLLNFKGGSFLIKANSYIENDSILKEFLDISHHKKDVQKIETISVDKIKRNLSKLARSTSRYQCESCGFSSQKLLWLCPSCKQWETQRPFSNVQFDSILQRMPLISD